MAAESDNTLAFSAFLMGVILSEWPTIRQITGMHLAAEPGRNAFGCRAGHISRVFCVSNGGHSRRVTDHPPNYRSAFGCRIGPLSFVFCVSKEGGSRRVTGHPPNYRHAFGCRVGHPYCVFSAFLMGVALGERPTKLPEYSWLLNRAYLSRFLHS